MKDIGSETGEEIRWYLTSVEDFVYDGDAKTRCPAFFDKEEDCKHAFRLKDDDGYIYAHGRISELDFNPLDTFMYGWGVTTLEYFNGMTRKWEVL